MTMLSAIQGVDGMYRRHECDLHERIRSSVYEEFGPCFTHEGA